MKTKNTQTRALGAAVLIPILALFFMVLSPAYGQDTITRVIKKEINGKRVKIKIYDKIEDGDSLVKEYEIETPDFGDYGGDDDHKEIHMQKRMEIVDEVTEEVLEDIEDIIEERMEDVEEQLEYLEELEELEHHDGKEHVHKHKIHINLGHGHKKPKTVEQSWFVMDLGWNVWLTDNTFELPEAYRDMELDRGRSVNFHLGILQQGVNLYKGRLRFVYGIGIEFNNYRFNKDIDILANVKPLSFAVNNDREYKKNKLVSQYATMPLMLNLKTKPDAVNETFTLAAGIQLGYLIGSHTKQKWGEDGKKEKRKIRGDYAFEDYRLGYVVQFGYGDFNLYGKYYPTEVFKSGQGPVANTASIGLVLTPF